MSALFPLVARGGWGDGHMGDWSWLIVVPMAVMMGGMGWMMWSMMRGAGSHGQGPAKDPVEVLKSRYARGELTTEELQERLSTIEEARR